MPVLILALVTLKHIVNASLNHSLPVTQRNGDRDMSVDFNNPTVEECITFHSEFMELWESEVDKSGKSPQMYLIGNTDAIEAAYLFDKFRDIAKEKHGLEFGDLVPGMTITEHD